jgi:hypothetical protein
MIFRLIRLNAPTETWLFEWCIEWTLRLHSLRRRLAPVYSTLFLTVDYMNEGIIWSGYRDHLPAARSVIKGLYRSTKKFGSLIKLFLGSSYESSAAKPRLSILALCSNIDIRVFPIPTVINGVAASFGLDVPEILSKLFEFGEIWMLEVDVGQPTQLHFRWIVLNRGNQHIGHDEFSYEAWQG